MTHFIRNLLELRIQYLERKQILYERKLKTDESHHEFLEEMDEKSNVCLSCETLRLELSRAHDENMRLIDALLVKPEVQSVNTDELKPITTKRHIPFAVRRQILEQEDRHKARIAAEQRAAEKETVVDEALTNDLEVEMQIVNAEREAESGQRVNEGNT